ncbi:MAG: polyisoprenyl-teichoic acid--peptidoglycan teichoic acid transferase [Clostridiales bacterium]|jgi:LCP family protein required for cell wall assembly|nr:polyisoprenyl-teichoic acid--peptidoglycan teichoic acid transferase [Clostridiales bacterium]
MRQSRLPERQTEDALPSDSEQSVQGKSNKKWLKGLITLLVFLGIGALVISHFYDHQVNFLVMGIEGTRTDTLIFVSVDTKDNTVKALSIPRDTYYPTEGKNGAGQKKINAVYGFKEIGGPEGVVNTVENLLGVSIDHYVAVDYDAVAAIVDLVGGVEVDVPYRMKYDDPYATPPLHIDFEPGVQVITGEHAIEYLRFRKSNDGTIREGDVQRIGRQQAFILSASKSLVTPKLPYIVYRALSYVDTDVSASEAVLIGLGMLNFDQENMVMTTLPMDSIGTGSDGLSYFFYDEAGTEALMSEWFK